MNFGPQTDEQDAFAIMDAALEQGINFFDTADVYGWKAGEGVTEQILGRWFAQGGERRERVVLATKVFGTMNRDGANDPNRDRGLSARKIIAGCEGSLKRMGIDHIDLYQMHHIDRECPVDEILRAMEILSAQGKVRYIGSSNFAGWDIATFNSIASQRGSLPLISEQSIYNLENRMVELEVLPACRHHGLGVIPWSPLAGGLLGGVLGKIEGGRRANENMAKRIGKKRDALEQWEALCAGLNQAPANVALAWLLHNPVVTAPIIGPRTMEQLEGVLGVPEMTLDEGTLERIDAIWPGPGGEAPNAYAW
jgi:aryl-alcohol dehydrogenase-like predicted oxidoreductase